mgnify:CR=1 FL=1
MAIEKRNVNDEVIVFSPFFPEYKVFIEKAGGKTVIVKSLEDYASYLVADRLISGYIYANAVYNKIFNTNFNKDNVSNFTPHQVSLKFYDDNKANKGVVYEKTFTIKDITSSAFIVNYNDFSDFINLYIAPYAVYLDNDDKVDNIVDGMNDFLISLPFCVLIGMFCKFGFVELSLPVAVRDWLYVV